MKNQGPKARRAVIATVLFLGTACGAGAPHQEATEDGARMALLLAGQGESIVLTTIDYVLTDAQGRTQAGSADVSSSTKAEFVIGNLFPGSYTITVTSSSEDGTTTCAGTSSDIIITAGATTPVNLAVTCTRAKSRGGVAVIGTMNLCPLVGFPSASPSEVLVGASLTIDAGPISDPDEGPGPLVGQWLSSPPTGVFADPAAALTTFQCTEPGTVTLRYSASDGDPQCAQSYGEVVISCTGQPCPQGTTWMPALAGCGGSVRLPAATESFAAKIYSNPGNAPLTVDALSSWAWLNPDPARQTSSAPVLVLAPYAGGYGCDFVSYHPENVYSHLSLDTLNPASTLRAAIVVPAGVDLYVVGSDCYLPDDADGEFLIEWAIRP